MRGARQYFVFKDLMSMSSFCNLSWNFLSPEKKGKWVESEENQVVTLCPFVKQYW